ncbi:MAG TPA: magnesium/cobalt transporter CorA [Methylomirabilota bacterium]|nr:magnesium/cobalt transporter CorA [Methylomirabilota bacterium]
MSGAVSCAVYAGGRRSADVALDDISEVLKQDDGKFIWIDLHEPDEPLLRKMQDEFGLHDLAVEDALQAHQRPKLELYDGSLFVVLRTVRVGPDRRLETGETHIFVGPRYVVSVRHGSSLSYEAVRVRGEANPELLKLGPGFVLYALMDFIVDHYFPVVEALEDQLESLEEEIFTEHFDRSTTTRIYRLKRELLALRHAVSPLVDITNRLMRFELALIPEAARPYFRDVYDHVVRINEMLDTLRELLSAALEANLSLISVSQADVVKRLTSWAAIIAVPTLIASIYGMNFRFMPEVTWWFGYPVALALMLGACSFLYFRFKRAGWL